ncbi:MAG: protein translocase subunit SecDF [Bacteroidales bacterium]|nr:protein translocase subunit SecDF [Bacteroidales bacterium]
MQNKGAIRLLIITLVLVTLYQLSFTFFVLDAKSDAKEYAKNYAGGDFRAEAAYLDSMANQEVYNFVWIKKYTLKECQERQINLGLDLQGGMNVVLQVSIPNLIHELSNNSEDAIFNKAIDLAKEESKTSTKDFITLFYEYYQELAPNGQLASIFATAPQLRGQIDYSFTNDQVIDLLRTEAQASIDNAFNILRTRIDRFGVTQPNIQQLEQSGRILVELPGVKDEERVRNLLQQSASLDFYLTYEAGEVWNILEEVDVKLSKILNEEEISVDTNTLLPLDTAAIPVDTNQSLLNNSTQDTTTLINDTIEDNLSKEEFLKEHPFLGRVYPATDQNGQLLPGPVLGYVSVSDTGYINKYLMMPEVRAMLPRDLILAWSVKPNEFITQGVYYNLIALKTTPDGSSQLGGDVITTARHNFNQNKGSAEVTMVMNASASKIWADLTGQNVGRSIAIVLDGNVYSYPTVNGEITGGVSQITGNFTIEEAQDLANVLKSGKLPVKINIAELNHVGPSLGKASIKAGFLSFLIAFLVVLIYMFLYYNKAGLVADIALISNMFFIIGVLASLGAVLTLPGIAGIVLTIGMSVDANVIIYDRIREELRAGKGMKKAIADGYKNAYSAIIDANVTTLLTGIVLYIFGHGPIQGFATTLIIGIFSSLFSAIFITRLVFEGFLKKDKPIKFAAKWSENILVNPKINFLGKRKTFYIISSILIIISIASLGIRGLDLGVDFVGGRSYVVEFKEDVNAVELATMLEKEFGTLPEVKTYGSAKQVKITTKYMIDSEDPNIENEIDEMMYKGFAPLLNNVTLDDFRLNYIQSSQKVGPTIASSIKRGSIYAILLSMLFIFLYIFIRFKNWQFGLGATVALLHDSIIVLGIFSLFYGILPFTLEVDQAFIAAILTVVGYSVNDTVIIFDRIREYFGLHPKRDKQENMNAAMNGTLSRTLNTSLTTLFVLLVIFLFGGAVIKGFVFALLIGILVGTYSSLFIASPITLDTMRKTLTKEEKAQKVVEQKQQVILNENSEKLAGETEEERLKRIEEKQRRDEKRKARKKKKNKNKK